MHAACQLRKMSRSDRCALCTAREMRLGSSADQAHSARMSIS